ncbi:MAG: cytochrome c [Gammaproteobacteria bacterium]|nr:cytochrome c [Gammaproteobacteria bacterium]
MNILKACLLLLIIGLFGGGLFVYSGVYNIGADVPHFPPVFAVLETFRDRSIAAHAQGVTAPPLDDPALIAEGGEHYAAMCSGCHLAPGKKNSEIRAGLYPQPPNLTEHVHTDAAEAFWVIKHGVKMTAMPAWGTTHDDQAIWGLVAFLQKLPGLSAEQYEHLAGRAAGHGHHHGTAQGNDDDEQQQGDHDAAYEAPATAPQLD